MSRRPEAIVCDVCGNVIEDDHRRIHIQDIGGSLEGEQEETWDSCSNCFNNKIRCVFQEKSE